MIPPLKAVASRTMMSNPIAINPQKAYNAQPAFAGTKLNIDCNEVRSLQNNKTGQKLDIMA